MTESTSECNIYLFVADSNGLMSLNLLNNKTQLEMFNSVDLHCRFNSHRRSVWGLLETTSEQFELLNGMMNIDPINALIVLKKMNISFSKNNSNMYKRFLETIPNKLLDPFN